MIIFLIIAYFFPVLVSANTKSYKSYVALGDSITYGYGLSNREIDSYPEKVRKKYNIEKSGFKNLAISGMTCAEFYDYIQNDEITQAIKDAEFVTISIGSNELLEIVTEAVIEATGITVGENEDLVEKVKEKINSVSDIEKLVILRNFYNNLTSEDMKIKIEAAIKSYQNNWSKSIKYIKEVNQDIFIVAIEFYNPYYEVAVLSYDFGGFVDENIQKLNRILWDSSNSEKEYKIAKIYDAFNTTNPRLTNVSTSMSDFNVDPHPNVLGHEVICTKVLDALTEVTTSKKDISELTITDIPDQNYTGKEIKPQVTIKDGDTKLIENIDYTISYSDNIEIGEAKVTIIGIGNYEGKVIKTFNIKDAEQKEIGKLKSNPIKDQVYTGIKITPDVEIFDGSKKLIKNKDYQLDYKDNINVGRATVIISGIGNYNGMIENNFNIVAKDISETTILDIPDQSYTGQEIEPNIEIHDGSYKLVKDVDYTISYQNNCNKGKATVKIEGKGNYTGSNEKYFNIIENNQLERKNISELTITDIEDKIYTGKLITPEVRITDGEKVLKKNTDYMITYNNNMNIGIGTAIIVGMGDYTGKVEKNFNILRKNICNTTIIDIADQIYTGKEIKPELIITSDHIKLEEGKDYIKEYKNNVEEGTAVILIQGIGNYTGNATKTFNIKKNNSEEIKENDKNNTEVEKDETVANKKLPFTGEKLLLCGTIVVTVIISIILFALYEKYKIIK